MEKFNRLNFGDRVCPVTNFKCQGLCPTPETLSNGFSVETGWDGNISKCQEGIYLYLDEINEDGKNKLLYLAAERYADFHTPMSNKYTRKSHIIGWGNYQKKFKSSYRDPFQDNVFFVDPTSHILQRSLVGPVLTRVNPMNLELAKLPTPEHYNQYSGSEELPEHNLLQCAKDKGKKEPFNFRSGYLLDLRELRMVKKIPNYHGTHTNYTSLTTPLNKRTEPPYRVPVNYDQEFNKIKLLETIYNDIKEKSNIIQKLISIADGTIKKCCYSDVKITYSDLVDWVENEKSVEPADTTLVLSYLIDKVIALFAKPNVYNMFVGEPLFGDTNKIKRNKFPDLYIYAWDSPFDSSDYDFTLYHIEGQHFDHTENNTDEGYCDFPEIVERTISSGDGYSERGLENALGIELLNNYFQDTGIQVGAMISSERNYLHLLGSTYMANLASFKK